MQTDCLHYSTKPNTLAIAADVNTAMMGVTLSIVLSVIVYRHGIISFITISFNSENNIHTIYDILTYSIQNPNASDFESKKKRIDEIGRELYADGGTDAMENIFYSIEFRIKEEIGKDARPYRSWWNSISPEWKY